MTFIELPDLIPSFLLLQKTYRHNYGITLAKY